MPISPLLILPPITILYASGSPPAILRAIRAAVINAVNGMFWGRLVTHVSEEVSEFTPPSANIYTSTAVITKESIFRVIAAISHSTPRSIKRVLYKAMLCNALKKSLGVIASTALAISVRKRGTPDNRFFSTITYARPIGYLFSSPMITNYGKSPTLIPSSVFNSFTSNVRVHGEHNNLLSPRTITNRGVVFNVLT